MKAALFSAMSLLLLGGALAGGGSAMATDNAIALDAQACQRQARAACMNGKSERNRVACLRKAEAAVGRARQGQGTRGGNAALGGPYRGLVLRERVLPSPAAPSASGPVEPAKCPASWPPYRSTPGRDSSENSRDGTCA